MIAAVAARDARQTVSCGRPGHCPGAKVERLIKGQPTRKTMEEFNGLTVDENVKGPK